MATVKHDWIPLELQADGTWSWPPRYEGQVKTFMSRIVNLEELVAHLVVHGPYESTSGYAAGDLGRDLDIHPAVLNSMLRDLELLGLIERKTGKRKTYRIASGVPEEQLPQAIEARIRDRRGDPKKPEPETPLETAHRIIAEPEPPIEDGVDYRVLATFMLDEVVRRATEPNLEAAPIKAERNHLAERLKKTEAELRTREKELEVHQGRLKAMRIDLQNKDDEIATLSSNLQAALDAAREHRRLGDVSDATRNQLDQLMRRAPGAPAGGGRRQGRE